MSWVDMATILLDIGRTAMGLAVNWLIQSTLLIAGGLAVGYLLRRRGSAVQSAVYRTSLVAALVCPLATWGLSLLGVSGWSLQMPTAYSTAPTMVPSVITAKSEPALTAETKFDSGTISGMNAATSTPPAASNIPPLAVANTSNLDAAQSQAMLEATPAPVSASEPVNEPTFDIHRFGLFAAAAAVLWVVAGTCLLCRLAVAWWHLHRLRRGARAAELATIESCREIAAWLRVAPPEVLHSPYLPSPCLAGLRRPVVMLPESELSQTVRDVLVHELAHLVRNDCFWNVARQVATAVLFFQPLAWILSRRLAATAEEVCDDYVVQFGGDRREYANRLVDIATMYVAPLATAGVGIVSFRSMLAARVARILDTSRSLSTRIGHLLLTIVLIMGLSATLLVGLVGLQSAPIAADQEAAKSADAKSDDNGKLTESSETSSKPDDADVVTVHGQVVDPKGAVAKNTDVCVIRWYWNYGDRQPLAKTKTDDQGRFTISYRKSQFFSDSGRPDQWREATIVAFADGFGFGWSNYGDLEPNQDAKLKLVVDDVPIEGRILDLEGKPVSDARIEVDYLNDSKNGNLDEWLAAVRARQSIQAAAKYLDGGVPLFSAQRWQGIKTDAEGRFRLDGIGRERQLNIQVSGPTIVTSTVSVVTRDMKAIAQPAYNYSGALDRINYGAKFQYTAAPSRPIEGIIRDAKTHEPIAGVEVWSSQFAGDNISGITTIKTKTDAKGHYRLEGMPKGKGNEIWIVPTDLPYFTRSFDVPDPPGMDPAPFDIELHRGEWVSGYVIDKVTKKGVPAWMYYIVAPDNPLAATLPEFKYGEHIMHVQDRFRTKPDGSYRVVGLPGRGVVGVGAINDAYPGGQGLESIKGVEDREGFRKYNGVFAPTKKNPTAVKEIQIPPDSDVTACNFELESGHRLTLRAVDQSGKPLKDIVVDGCRGKNDNFQKIVGPEFDVIAMRDDEVRTILVHQESRRLGKAIRLKLSDGAKETVTVPLEPCATVIGQLVNADDQPVRGASLRIDVEGDGDYGKELQRTATDENGRFRHDGFLPGLTYSVFAEGAKIEFATIAKKLDVHSGETIDLGTIDITSKKRPEMMRTAAASATDKGQAKPPHNANSDVAHYDGKVVTPDGKPADRADIYLVFHIPQSSGLLAPTWKPVGTTDAGGEFHFEIKPGDFGEFARQNEWQYASIVAVKSGYGFGWSSAAFYESSGEPLRVMKARIAQLPANLVDHVAQMLSGEGQPLKLLSDEVPIRGRVVDINGQPVAGARLTLLEVWTGFNNDLTGWRKASKEPNADYYTARSKTPQSLNGPQVRSLVTPAITDAKGQFTLRGIGRGRIADLLLEGPQIESARFFARTEKGETIELAQEHRSPDLGTYKYYPAEFDYLAGPSKPIIGVVRDAETKQPLAGVTVKSQSRHGHKISGWGQDFVRVITGADGRYSLEGMPLGNDNRIAAVAPNDKPYFSSGKTAALKSDGPPLTVDFDLSRGVWAEGRITDKQTRKGLAGELHYMRDKDSPNLTSVRMDYVDERDRLQADDDGRFRIVVSPGLGYVTFSAYDHENYPRADAVVTTDGKLRKAETSTEPQFMTLANYHMVAEINPAVDAKRYELNLQLDNGGILTGHAVGPDGKPLNGFQYSGRQAQPPMWRPAKGAAFEIVGNRADSPRKLYFAHREKNLAATMTLTGEPPKDLVIKLESAGTARGRLIDRDGEPLAHMQLVPWSPPIASPADLNRAFESVPLPPNSQTWQDGRYETDDKGQFEIACLVPGVEYRLMAFNFQSMTPQTGRTPKLSGRLEKSIVVESGQTLDLGEVQLTEDSPAKKVPVSSAPNGTTPAVGKLQSKPAPTPVNAAELALARKNEIRASEKKEGAQKIFGGVVGADGKPVAGAKMYWITWSMRGDQAAPQLVATTDQKGEFAFVFPGIASNEGQTVDHMQSYHVVVVAPGHGMAYLSAYDFRPTDPISAIAKAIANGRPGITVTLPADAPIKGRVVNVDGQPVANVRVSIRGITGSQLFSDRSHRRDLEARGRDKQEIDWRLRLNELTHVFWPAQLPSIAPTAKTDADGKFELRSVGKDRIAQLLIEGDNIASAIVNVRSSPGETLTLAAAPNFGTEPDTLNATGFTHVAAPSKPLEGRVVDLDTSKPLAGAVVRTYAVHGDKLHSSRGRQYLAARTDAEGHYRITGLPAGDSNGLVAFTVGDEPYVPVGCNINTDVPTPTAHQDFKLKRGVWAQGRAYDATTKAPLPGALEYYIVRNPDLERAVPGIRFAFIDEHYFTGTDGRFRVPVLAARGILAFRYAPLNGMETTKYPRGVGAEKISGGVGKGEMVYFETLPSYLMSSNYQAIAEVAPNDGQKSTEVDFALSSGRQITVQAVDESGKPVTDLEVYGQTENYGWQNAANSTCQVKALQPGKTRELYFLQRSRNLVGAATVDTDTKDGLIVKLSPGGGIRGRLVNDDGEPIIGATLIQTLGDNPTNAAIWPDHPGLMFSPGKIPVDAKGRFEIDGLIPGKNYAASVDVVQKMNGQMREAGIGRVFAEVKIEPGKMLDLGDVRPEPDQKPRPPEKKKSSKSSLQKAKKKGVADMSPTLGIKIHGQVTGPDGKPIAGAHVAAIGVSSRVAGGGDLSSRDELLGETASNSDGQYELRLPNVSASTYCRANLISRADGAGVAWRSFDIGRRNSEVVFDLPVEKVFRGKLVDIEGKPAAKVRMSIGAVMPTSTILQFEGIGFRRTGNQPVAWPQSVTTDNDGQFAIHGIPVGHGVSLTITGTDLFAPQNIVINSGMPEQRGERDGTYRPQIVKNLKPGEEAVLALAPAQIFEGVVSYEDTGKPAPHARLTIWASQQKFGSMYSVAGQADEQGRYRISPYPGIRFGITAYPPDDVAYLARKLPPIEWEDSAGRKEANVKLPPGLLVRGHVLESGTGIPVAHATVQYILEEANNPSANDDILTGWQGIQLSNESGEFNIAVLPGKGRLIVHGPKGEYVLQEMSGRELDRGRPGGSRRYANAIKLLDLESGSKPIDVTVELRRGAKIAGRLVDEKGLPVDEAILISPLNIDPTSLFWRGDSSAQVLGGQFNLIGLAAGQKYKVHFLDAKRRLGATTTLTAGDNVPNVVLKPCGHATARFVDGEGRPRAGLRPSIHMVVTPGVDKYDMKAAARGELAADADFVSNIDRVNYSNLVATDNDGRITFPALIPGATYRVEGFKNGAIVIAKEFTIDSGQGPDLGDIVVEESK